MRILYATDGSEGARAAGKFLRGLPLSGGAQIHIVTVTDRHERDAVLQDARASLDGLPCQITTLGLSGGSTATTVDAILAAADAIAADLIVVGPPGHPTLLRLFVGSVADGLARTSRTPVLIVRTNGATTLNRVIVGIDSSERSREAVAWIARTFPLPASCEVHLMAVVPSETWTRFAVPASRDDDLAVTPQETIRIMTLEDEERRAESWLESLAIEARAAPRPFSPVTITTELRQGIPADELIRAAEGEDSLLVLAENENRAVLDRLLSTSVSARVLGHSNCSVLVVRPCANHAV
ncbi:MAG: universal stress protein [Armatimonadota bacterium]